MDEFDKNVQESDRQHCGETYKTPASKVGYVTGQIVGTVLCACAAAVVVALTTKFIFWLF